MDSSYKILIQRKLERINPIYLKQLLANRLAFVVALQDHKV